MSRRFAWSLVPFAMLVAGCLGRTGLSAEDLEAYGPPLDDAAGDTSITIVESGPETGDPPPTDTGADRFIDIWDVFPIPDSGPIGACASCVRDKCGDRVNACINDAACRAGLACTVTRCLTGGGGGGGSGGMGFKDFSPADLEKLPPSTRFTFRAEAFAPWHNSLRASACEQRLISCEH